MVKPDKNGICTIGCFNCPISGANNGENKDCVKFVRLYPEKATEIIRKWAEEHPQKTRAECIVMRKSREYDAADNIAGLERCVKAMVVLGLVGLAAAVAFVAM